MKVSRNLTQKYKQFGLKGFIIRVLRTLLRKIGINYEAYDYYATFVDKDMLLQIWNKNPIENVKILSFEDFLFGDKSVFTEKKLKIIKNRLNKKNYKAYGIIENNVLYYSCWICDNELVTSSPSIKYELKSNECLLLDAYCHPTMRGKGMHTRMNAYRCLKAIEINRPKCIVIVLKGNIPAQKTQQKCGLKVLFSYYILDLWGKRYTNFYRQKQKYDC